MASVKIAFFREYMSKKINEKTKYVLITGAYGGMGYKTAKELASRGFTVFALDKKTQEGEENIIPIEADVTDAESLKDAFERVKRRTDELFAILHFAGVYMLDSLIEMGDEAFDKIFKINVYGAFYINKIFMPLLKNGSRIFSSIPGLLYR